MQAKIWNFWIWTNDFSIDNLDNKYLKNLRDSGFTVLNQIEHNFSPHGYTCLYLLGESHFAIHTFPEEKTAFFQLSSCNKEKYYKFIDLCGWKIDHEFQTNPSC